MMRFNQSIDRVLSYVSAVVLIIAVLHVVAHALMRSFFTAPIYGTNEIVTYWYLPIIVLLGIPAAQLQSEHINVTLVTERMSNRMQRLLRRFSALISLALCVGFAWYGFGEAMDKFSVGATAGVTNIITWPVYFVVPVGFIVLGYLYAIHLFRPEQHLLPIQEENQ
ncbi:MAG: TRAP transporter small permease [Micrococcaceae bacterium]